MCAYWTGPAVYTESYIESKKLVVVGKTPLTPNILYGVSQKKMLKRYFFWETWYFCS